MKTAGILGALLFLVALNCFISPVYAFDLDYYSIESVVRSDMLVNNVIKLNLNESVDSLEYKVKYRIFNLETESEYAPVGCDAQVLDTSTIICNFTSHDSYDSTRLIIKFDTREMVDQADEKYDFNHFVTIEGNVKKFFHFVYLPPTATLTEDDSFSPKDGKILSDGKHIIVSWDRENLEKGDDIYFSVNYSMPSGGTFDVWIVVIIAVIIIVLLGIFYMKTTQKHGSIKVIMPLLRGDEKTVVDIIEKNGGSVNQRLIVRESDFSKAKVSRLVANLKERGIVDVEVMGRTNKVTLKVKR